MLEAKSGSDPAFDQQLSVVRSPVVCATQRDDVVGSKLASIFAGQNVMQIEERVVPAAGHLATTLVAAHNFAPKSRREVLRSAPAMFRFASSCFALEGRGQSLGVASGHIGYLSRDFNQLAAALLPSSPAVFADAELDLVAGATFVELAAEQVTCHQQQRTVVIERAARVAAKLGHRVAERGQNFARHLEAQHVRRKRSSAGSVGKLRRTRPETSRSTSRTVRPRAASSHAFSVFATATRVSSLRGIGESGDELVSPFVSVSAIIGPPAFWLTTHNTRNLGRAGAGW